MNWTEVCIHTTREAVESISYVLHEAGLSGLIIEDPLDLIKARDSQFGEIYELNPNDYPEEGVRIKAYLPVNSYLKDSIAEIREEINKLTDYHDMGKNEITLSEVHEEDWATAWKKYYKPLQVTDNITIKPIWETYEPKRDSEIIIEMDPGMAFGTGTHPTTVLSIQALEKYAEPSNVVIDVGSGSGVLSIAAAKLGAEKVYAYDLDEVAVKSSKSNIAMNELTDKISVKQNNLLRNVDLQAEVIVSNILAEIIVKFVDDAWKNLKNKGFFITSGIIETKKETVLEQLKHQGFEIIEVNELEEWISIVAMKP
ncbi:50S ribosomal protein L11 methyltransferase [Oceanobacillus luteolus]|uniref:Ribosomal protein L11 methyltransferase n=1 Tax=Oceanobacillus luteolus TaxID=1274358 RepID=A0ABW4HXH4_9BACI|nr:50S ribosomal protein L11 methyltransferase [Oceanobacillus luteolus]MCM3738691.1 50S ribosomal protein L11 methyltransferase [Oceanobacillus luteolus]